MCINTMLLIVPYGIETKQKYGRTTISHSLLIVPYGIETHDRLYPDGQHTYF